MVLLLLFCDAKKWWFQEIWTHAVRTYRLMLQNIFLFIYRLQGGPFICCTRICCGKQFETDESALNDCANSSRETFKLIWEWQRICQRFNFVCTLNKRSSTGSDAISKWPLCMKMKHYTVWTNPQIRRFSLDNAFYYYDCCKYWLSIICKRLSRKKSIYTTPAEMWRSFIPLDK